MKVICVVGCLFVDVAPEATGVIAQAVGLRVWWYINGPSYNRAEIEFPTGREKVQMSAHVMCFFGGSLFRFLPLHSHGRGEKKKKNTHSLKGPQGTQPPPLPGCMTKEHCCTDKMHVAFLPGTYAPSPDRLVSLPSNNGPAFGSCA